MSALPLHEAIKRSIGQAYAKKEITPPKSRGTILGKMRPLIALPPDEARRVDEMVEAERQVMFTLANPGQNLDSGQFLALKPDFYDLSPDDIQRRRQEQMAYNEQVKAFFRTVFAEQQATFDDFLSQRVKVCWRIVRELCRIRGVLTPDDTLMDGLAHDDNGQDLWTTPKPYLRPVNQQQRTQLSWEAISILKEAEVLPDEMKQRRYDFNTNQWIYMTGLGVLPPAVPCKWLTDKGNVNEFYDPDKDQGLDIYIKLIAHICDILHIELGSADEPDLGRYGTAGLFDPTLIRLIFPSRMQLIAWEQLLIEETIDLLVEKGLRETKVRLFKKYGLQGFEAGNLLRLARAQAKQQLEGDVEEDRAITLLKLEDYIRRSRDALDLRAELAGLKQVSLVLGLNKMEPNDTMSEFINVVRQVSHERQAQRREVIDGSTVRLLQATPSRSQLSNASFDDED